MSATSSSFPAIAKASLCDAFSPTASFASINCDTGAHSRVRRHQPPTTSHNWLQQALIGSFNARRSLNISKTRLVGQMHHLWVLPVDSLQTSGSCWVLFMYLPHFTSLGSPSSKNPSCSQLPTCSVSDLSSMSL
ncbi:hypothetical protein P3342_007732 [Pyrenophora teres f. teres]|nr:hypothetical protein P3342_007732 [Pyrenophora teres f. teres]